MRRMNDEKQKQAIALRNRLSALCDGIDASTVASAMSDLLVEVYRNGHPSPTLDNYLEQMRLTWEWHVAQERPEGRA